MDLSSLLVNGGSTAMMLWSSTTSDDLRPYLEWTKHQVPASERQCDIGDWCQLTTPESVGYFVQDLTGDAGVKLTMRLYPGVGKTGEFFRLYRSRALPQEPPLVIPLYVPQSLIIRDAHSPHVQAVRWIQRAVGLSDGRIAEILDVSRQTILDWKSGTPVRDKNLQNVLETQDVLKRAARRFGSPEELRTWLYTPDPDDGDTPFVLLRERKFDRARFLAVQTPTDVDPVPDWAKRPIAPGWQDALEELERSGEFEANNEWNDS